MKKLLFGATITLAFIGCNSDEPDNSEWRRRLDDKLTY